MAGKEKDESPSKIETAIGTARLVAEGILFTATGKTSVDIVADTKAAIADTKAAVEEKVDSIRTQAKNAQVTVEVVAEGVRIMAGGEPHYGLTPPPCPTNPNLMGAPGCKPQK